MTDSDDLLNTLQQLEVELHNSSSRASERAAQLLADSFVEFGASGQIYSKTKMLTLLAAEVPPIISASQFSARRIAADVVLLTYVACRHASPDVFSLRSSIWQFEDSQWRITFHQGTPCAQPPAQG